MRFSGDSAFVKPTAERLPNACTLDISEDLDTVQHWASLAVGRGSYYYFHLTEEEDEARGRTWSYSQSCTHREWWSRDSNLHLCCQPHSQQKASADGSDLIASVFCSFPTRPAFTCTEIIKLTRGWSGRNAHTIAFRKWGSIGRPFLLSQPGKEPLARGNQILFKCLIKIKRWFLHWYHDKDYKEQHENSLVYPFWIGLSSSRRMN